MPRKLKDGWPIYKEWVEISLFEPRQHWILTDCRECSSYRIAMPLSKLVANGPDLCPGCIAYKARLSLAN